MPAIGMALGWAGYAGMLWAWCLLRGYPVTLGQLVNPVHLLDWKTATAGQIPDTQVFPGVAQPGSSAGTPPPIPPNPDGTCPKGYFKDPKTGKCVTRIIGPGDVQAG